MSVYDRKLTQGLFTLATIILEDTHLAASAGQSLKKRPAQYKKYAAVLRAAARDLDAAAGTIQVVLNRNAREHHR